MKLHAFGSLGSRSIAPPARGCAKPPYGFRSDPRYASLKLFIVLCLSAGIAAGLSFEASARGNPAPADLQALLRQRIQAQLLQSKFVCRDELICGIAELPRFYQQREFLPAWFLPEGSFAQADALIGAIRMAPLDGLEPLDYHLVNLELLRNRLQKLMDRGETIPGDVIVDFELLLTDAFLLFGSHLLGGRVNPETIHTKWMVFNPEVDMSRQLESALDAGRVAETLAALRPPQRGYRALKQALADYRAIEAAGGWPLITDGTYWEQGDHDARMLFLRQRLEMSNDLAPSDSHQPFVFDGELEKALRHFQKRHNLAETGVLDAETLEALNVPVSERIRQIELNLERWRWVPRQFGQRHIRVNIADFKLQLFEGTHSVLEMRVVVGRDYRKTPVFSDRVRYLVINPYWNIPTKIAVEDILPQVTRNPAFLQERGIKVYRDWSKDAEELDPLSIDWSVIDKGSFRFKFQKAPGPANDLGQFKFMFPNRFAVYLHDTPSRQLFQPSVRGFSSGCIRIEKPLELAVYLLQDQPQWQREDILAAVADRQHRKVFLSEPLPVHLLYWTAWVDGQGRLQFRRDFYGRDLPLDLALKERPPRA